MKFEEGVFTWGWMKKHYPEVFFDMLEYIYDSDIRLKASTKRQHFIVGNRLSVGEDSHVFHTRDIEGYFMSKGILLSYGAYSCKDKSDIEWFKYILSTTEFPSQIRSKTSNLEERCQSIDCENFREVLSCLYMYAVRLIALVLEYERDLRDIEELEQMKGYASCLAYAYMSNFTGKGSEDLNKEECPIS